MKKRKYISIKTKFTITVLVVLLFLVLACVLNYWWFSGLNRHLPWFCALIIILGVAIFPGILMCIMLCGVLLDKPRDHAVLDDLPDITVLIAAYNEEESIYETLQYLSRQQYHGNLTTLVIDNRSTDGTRSEILRAQAAFAQIQVQYVLEEKPGKFNALNKGLSLVTTPFFVTLDADTLLYQGALNKLLTTMTIESQNKSVASVAGSVLVRNSRKNVWTALQEWDYFLSITGIKRSQGLFQSTLVAQGAYSVYNTAMVQEIGGWNDSIGEDIVLSWNFLARGWSIYFEPSSIAFTTVPETFRGFWHQRARWARGMVEGLRQRPFWSYPTSYSRLLIGLDILLFLVDFSIVFIWFPGLLLALLGNFLIVGPLTLLLLPLTLLVFSILFRKEYKGVFQQFGLRVRKHWGSFALFLLTYQLIMAPISLIGYCQEITNRKRRWK